MFYSIKNRSKREITKHVAIKYNLSNLIHCCIVLHVSLLLSSIIYCWLRHKWVRVCFRLNPLFPLHFPSYVISLTTVPFPVNVGYSWKQKHVPYSSIYIGNENGMKRFYFFFKGFIVFSIWVRHRTSFLLNCVIISRLWSITWRPAFQIHTT